MKPNPITYCLAGAITLSILSQAHALVIENPNPSSGDSFGWSLGVSGDTTIVGAFKSGNGGSVYVFDTNTGEQKLTLTPGDVEEDDYFGFWASISGNNIIVSAANKTIDGNDMAGAIYVFDATTGEQKHKLTASDGGQNHGLGWTSAIYGNHIIAGAPLKPNGGSAYLYDATTGQERHILTASDAAAGDNFGWSGALDGTTAILGANKKDGDTGAAYIFDTTTGQQLHKLTALDAAASDEFGYAVDISGNTAIVGASMKTENGEYGAGAVYLFNTDDGSQTTKITSSNANFIDRFGSCVTLDGDTFAVTDYGAAGSTKAYLGSVASLTTLDLGNTKKIISGISFESQQDWVIGQNTIRNTVVLSAGDAATVMATGKAIYIGMNAAADANTLEISGTLTAEAVYIGSIGGNIDNLLQFNTGADYSQLGAIYLTAGNALAFEWAWSQESELFDFLDTTELYAYDSSGNNWVLMDQGNYTQWLSITDTANSGMLVRLIPEPACATYSGLAALAALLYRKRRQNNI